MGIICHVKYYYHMEYIGKGYVNVITIFIVAGIVMMVAGALGIFCIVRKSYSSLMACLIIIAVLIILHFILGGLAFSYRSRVRSYHCFIYVLFKISYQCKFLLQNIRLSWKRQVIAHTEPGACLLLSSHAKYYTPINVL